MVLAAPDAFTETSWPEDTVRLVLVTAAVFMAMVVIRVAYLRGRAGDGPDRDRMMLGLVSYGTFIFIAVYDGLQRFGLPLDWVRVALYLIGLGTGVAAVFAQVKFRPWSGLSKQAAADRQREEDEAAGRAARLGREGPRHAR